MCKFTARKLLLPLNRLTHRLLHTDILTYIQVHIHLQSTPNIHKLKLKNSLTFKNTYAFTLTHWHIQCFTQTCSNMHSIKWPCSQILSNWDTNTYSQMLPLTPSLTHVIHSLNMQNMLTRMHEHRHAHIHLGAQTFTHRKYTHMSFCVHTHILHECSHYIN